jgi:hypothetical protein
MEQSSPINNQTVPAEIENDKRSVPYYADMHCHPTFMPYNRSHIEKTTVNEFWPQVVSEETVEKQRTKDQPTFTQSDFTTLSQSGVRVCFASLLPLEQGFLWYHGKAIAIMAAKSAMKIPWLRSCRVQSARHDYFKDLEKEYSLLTKDTNWQCPAEVLATKPRAKVVSNYAELVETLSEEKNTIAVVITIEGGHSLGGGTTHWLKKIGSDQQLDRIRGDGITDLQLDDASFAEPSPQCDMVKRFESAEVREFVLMLLTHIKKMKSWGEGKFAPFFITFSHHFWNQMCGHAISLPRKDVISLISGGKNESDPDLMVELWDQDRGLEVPMTEVGKVVICALLSKNNGEQVLIDTKHMSQPGKDWYYGCVEKFNEGLKDELKIPIISSHSAANERVSMPKTGDDNTGKANRDYENSDARFNIWNINLTNEEILRIHKSNGIKALNFDERILAGKQWRKKLRDVDPKSPEWAYEWAKPIAEHLYHVAAVIATKEGLLKSNPTWDDQVAKKVWRRLGIGTDLDGAINPVDAYCRAIDFTDLEPHLKQRLADMRDHEDGDEYSLSDYPLLNGLQNSNIAQIVDWFMRGNAMDFLMTYFKDEYRSGNK